MKYHLSYRFEKNSVELHSIFSVIDESKHSNSSLWVYYAYSSPNLVISSMNFLSGSVTERAVKSGEDCTPEGSLKPGLAIYSQTKSSAEESLPNFSISLCCTSYCNTVRCTLNMSFLYRKLYKYVRLKKRYSRFSFLQHTE